MSSELLSLLNPVQRDAVSCDVRYALVLAGAGSGKTRVLTHRIAWLLQEKHVVPTSIFAVTFTNKAASEMRARVGSLLGVNPNHMWIGTFHGLAHRLLRLHWHDAGLEQNFHIIDSDDQARILRRLLKSLEVDSEKFPVKQVLWFINAQKNEGKRARHLTSNHDPYFSTMLSVYKAYEEYCDQEYLVDFGELLLRAFDLLSQKSELLQHYQQRFKFLLVDEFQDINSIQYAWIRLLAGSGSEVFIVGDDDQSIYGWRGAKTENIKQFCDDFAGTAIFRLEQNYRSTSVILKAANALIAKNSVRLGKELWTENQEGELISLFCAYNEVDEASFVADRVKSLVIDDKCSFHDFVVLYRSNAQSRVLEEAFLQRQIPYRVYGGQRFFERAEIKDALAYVSLAHSFDDNVAFERVVNVPARGLGDRSVEVIRDCSRVHEVSLGQAAVKVLEKRSLPVRAHNSLQQFVDFISEKHSLCDSLSLGEFVEDVVNSCGLLDHFAKDKSGRGQDRVENVQELFNATRAFKVDPDDEMLPLTAFLAHSALDSAGSDASSDDCVSLMTLHSVKGLEFPFVFLVGLEEGLFPHQLSKNDPKKLEEERRLCYVGMTRAMEQLFMCYAENRRQYGSYLPRMMSRFIKEVPAEFLSSVRLGSDSFDDGSFSQSLKFSSSFSSPFSSGQSVQHKKFGSGVVLDQDGEGDSLKLQIRFSDSGVKWILADYVMTGVS